jgi:hypothetical protein
MADGAKKASRRAAADARERISTGVALQSIIAAQAGALPRFPSPSGDHHRKPGFEYGPTMACSNADQGNFHNLRGPAVAMNSARFEELP